MMTSWLLSPRSVYWLEQARRYGNTVCMCLGSTASELSDTIPFRIPR